MSYETFLALRYLASSRKRAHVALISTISLLGLGVGVAALVLSLSLLSGFQDRIRSQMAQRSPHLTVFPARGGRLADAERVARVLKALPGVGSVEPAIEGRAWVSDLEGKGMLPIRYRNARPRTFEAADPVTDPRDPAKEGDFPQAGVSSQVAARTGTAPGGLIRLTSFRTRLSPIGPLPIAAVFRVSEIIRGGALEKITEVEVSEKFARLLSGTASGAGAYEARLTDAARAERAARSLGATLGSDYQVRTWRELNAPLSFALRLEKVVIFVTVALIILVAALNIVSNIALLVVEKKRDLGVLISLGATPRSLARVYLTLGAAIGLLGTGGGIGVGVAAALLLDRFRAVRLPADVYLLTHVPFAVHPREVLLVALFAFGTAVAAALLPARAAGRLAPGEAVRLSR